MMHLLPNEVLNKTRQLIAQYHTIWYRALQLDQSEDGGNLLSETMVQYWNDEITLDELVDRLTPRLKLYLDE